MKLFRRWLVTSASVAELSADMVSQYLQRAGKPDQFAGFDLPAENTFAQVKRLKS